MSLLKNFATVGSGTASSRVLGFIRDIFIAAALGTGPVADAFFVAQRLPNLFRRLFAEGAFASAFVPLFTKSHESDGAEAARRFAEESLAALAAALLVVTVVAEIAMVVADLRAGAGLRRRPGEVRPRRAPQPDRLPLSPARSRSSTLLSGALNGIGRFAAAAFSPVAPQRRADRRARLRLRRAARSAPSRAGVLLTVVDHRRRRPAARLPLATPAAAPA